MLLSGSKQRRYLPTIQKLKYPVPSQTTPAVTRSMIADPQSAIAALQRAWPQIVEECRQVLGSELHYQAMIYHALRTTGGVPVGQLGMNVKQYIPEVSTGLFSKLADSKHKDYQRGFEPIPDVVIFRKEVDADWRRRNCEATLRKMLLAIEVKASERADGRLRPGEIVFDIDKLAAHREEVRALGSDFLPVMMVVDTAPLAKERMTTSALKSVRDYAETRRVSFLYLDPTSEIRETALNADAP